MQVTLRNDTYLKSMDQVFSLLVTGLALIIVPMVYTQQIALRHNGTTYNDIAYINEDAVFYIECETQYSEDRALTIRIPTAPTCAQCYPDGFSYIDDQCIDFVQFECLTNDTFRGELTVNVPPLGRYYCTYISAINETFLSKTNEPHNVTINGSAYAVMGENTNFTCSTSLAAPRPTFEWFTTNSNGTGTEIVGDTEDIDDDGRHYNTINIVIPSGKEILDIWCVAKQTAFDVDLTSEKLQADILVRATPPEWGIEAVVILYEPDEPQTLNVSSNDARPKANATWFYSNGTEDHIIDGDQTSWNKSDKIWHDIVFRPSAYHDGMDVYCSVNQGPPLYAQTSSLRRLRRSDITTEDPETTTDYNNNQETTDSSETFQGLSTGEIIGIVVGSVVGAAILWIILVCICCPTALASCGLLSCCVKSATLKNTDENIPIQ